MSDLPPETGHEYDYDYEHRSGISDEVIAQLHSHYQEIIDRHNQFGRDLEDARRILAADSNYKMWSLRQTTFTFILRGHIVVPSRQVVVSSNFLFYKSLAF
jgi:hypothetical protein